MQKSNQSVHAICRLQNSMGEKKKEIFVSSFVYSIFNYGRLVWHFCSKKSIGKIEKIQERCLRIILDDYEGNYDDYEGNYDAL